MLLLFSSLVPQKSYKEVTWETIKYWEVIGNVPAVWTSGAPV